MQDLRFLVFLLEGVAAISGLYYFKKNPDDKATGFFAYFLLFTFFVESVGFFPAIIYWNEELHFLKQTLWYRTFWLYNPYLVISFIAYILYFKWNISKDKTRKIINKGLILYFIICVANLIFTDVFFKSNSSLTYVLGSFFLSGMIFYYYFEILSSSKILNIKREISFYISIPALLYFLTTTPIFIYFKYFTGQSPQFVQLSSLIMITMNILMYSSYSFALLWLANKKKTSPENLKVL